MQSSAYYAAKIKEFESIKNNISSLFGAINNCATVTSNCTKYTNEIIISKKVVDNGELNKLSMSLQTISGNLTTIIAECDEKIAKYQALYEQALAWEREQAQKKK